MNYELSTEVIKILDDFSDLKGQLILVCLSGILTIILSLGIWTKPLNFIIKPKWNDE